MLYGWRMLKSSRIWWCLQNVNEELWSSLQYQPVSLYKIIYNYSKKFTTYICISEHRLACSIMPPGSHKPIIRKVSLSSLITSMLWTMCGWLQTGKHYSLCVIQRQFLVSTNSSPSNATTQYVKPNFCDPIFLIILEQQTFYLYLTYFFLLRIVQRNAITRRCVICGTNLAYDICEHANHAPKSIHGLVKQASDHRG